ncbi:MAG: methyltransferase domain-containing protein [Rhizobiales bacterium]|nr:methyltransferase domain-containing protein [Hyphomicrobiales bacterium]
MAARQAAVRILDDILKDGITLDSALEAALGGLAHVQDRGLVRAIATTSLRRKGQIDNALGQFLAKPLPAKSGIAGSILVAAAAQLVFMRVPPHAAIDLAVRQARQDRNARHFSGLINAVLRKVSGTADTIAAETGAGRANTPDWLWQRWSGCFGDAVAGDIAEAHLIEPALDLSVKDGARANHWAGQLGGVVLANGSVRISGATGRIEDLPGYGDGEWWVQDAAASLPVAMLGDVKDLRVLDLCAAPGGKTAQLAAAGARVTAVDLSEARLARVGHNLQRLGLGADLVCRDAVALSADDPYDAVICDVPCSATGTIRRHPDLPYLKTAKQMTDLTKVQSAILGNAVNLTRPGGVIVYCTCSLECEECEVQIESLLASDAPVARDPVTPEQLFGQAHLVTERGELRSLPFHALGEMPGLDGFYACRLRKS